MHSDNSLDAEALWTDHGARGKLPERSGAFAFDAGGLSWAKKGPETDRASSLTRPSYLKDENENKTEEEESPSINALYIGLDALLSPRPG